MKRRVILPIALMLGLAILRVSNTSATTQPILPEEQGSLSEVIDKFRLGIIPRDSGKYVVPSQSDLQSAESAFSILLAWMNIHSSEKLSEAASSLAAIDYALVRFTDVSGRIFYIAREASGFNRGWGLYIVCVKAPSLYRNLMIEVPHIGFDEFTEKIGVRSFIQSYSGFLLVAGAHRYANPGAVADVAHTEQCVFHVVHKTWCTNTSTTIQIHGFAEASAGRELYPQIILSSGAPEGSSAVTEMSNILIQNGLTVGIFDGTRYTDLGATTNVQGKYARSVGGKFVHMEIARAVRSSDELSGKVVKGLERFAEEVVVEISEFRFPTLVVISTILVSWPILATRKKTRPSAQVLTSTDMFR